MQQASRWFLSLSSEEDQEEITCNDDSSPNTHLLRLESIEGVVGTPHLIVSLCYRDFIPATYCVLRVSGEMSVDALHLYRLVKTWLLKTIPVCLILVFGLVSRVGRSRPI